MVKKPQKIIVLTGPTATGKSDLAVVLAKKFNGEIISADSRQVYRDMNVGTGKITKKEMRGVPHHLLDIASPRIGNYNAAKFQRDAFKKIADIASRNKKIFLVGGTGFWIDAVAQSQNFPDVPPNSTLRKELAKQSAPELFALLQKLDSTRAQTIDHHNKVRLVRAIEIAKSKSKTVSKELPEYEVLYLGLDLPSEVLNKKIEQRLDQRLKKGMIKEVQKLHFNGVSWKKLEYYGLEYRHIAQYLQNKVPRAQMRDELYRAIRKYAKRQKTWFKRNKKIVWFDPRKKTTAKLAAVKIKKFLKN